MSIQALMNPANGEILPQFIDNAAVTKSSSFMTPPFLGGATPVANTIFPNAVAITINPPAITPIFVLPNIQVPADMLSRTYLYMDTDLFVNFSAAIGGGGNSLSVCTGICQPAGGTGPYTVVQVPFLNLETQPGIASNVSGFVTLYSAATTATKMIIKFSEIYDMTNQTLNHINWTQPFDIMLFGASTEAIAGGVTVNVNMQSRLSFNKVGP